MTQRNLGSAAGGLARGGDLESEFAAGFLDQSNEQVAERHRFAPDLRLIDLQPDIHRDLERQHAEHRWRASEVTADAGRGPVVAFKGKWCCVAHPSGDW